MYEEPFDFNATELIVSEDAPIGTLVGSVSQNSGKTDPTVMYSLLQKTGQLPPPFMLERTGELVTTQLLDYESVSSYPISIRAVTESGEMLTHEFVVEVMDVYEEPFDFNATELIVSEDAQLEPWLVRYLKTVERQIPQLCIVCCKKLVNCPRHLCWNAGRISNYSVVGL